MEREALKLAQETEMLTIAYQSGYHDGKKAALAGREWVGLTDEQQEEMYQMTDNLVDCRTCYFQGIADAEAAHSIKEKNT
jgi:hypothetical protein